MAELDQVVPGEPINTTTFGSPVIDRVISRYADATERDFKVPAPQAGDPAYLVNIDAFQIFDGTTWVTFAPTSALDLKVDRAGDTMSGQLSVPAVQLTSNSEGGGGIRWEGVRRLAFGDTASIYDTIAVLRARYGDSALSSYVQRLYKANGSTVLNEVDALGKTRAREDAMTSLVETFPRGTLLESAYVSGSAAPPGNVLTHSVTLDYPGQTVLCDASAMMRSSDLDAGDGFEAQIVIDGNAFANARVKALDLATSSHNHSSASHSHSIPTRSVQNTSGNTNGHTHERGSYNTASGSTGSTTPGSTGSTTQQVSGDNAEGSVSPIALLEFTPAGSSFSVQLSASIRSGSPSSWFEAMKIVTWRA